MVRWPSVRLHVFRLGSAITTRRVRDMPVWSRNTKRIKKAVDGLDGSIFNPWGGIWVGVSSSENRYTICDMTWIHCVYSVQYIVPEFDHIYFIIDLPCQRFWLVQYHHPPCSTQGMQNAFYDKIPCKRMSCGSSLFHLNILLARYWTICTRVLIGTHIKKYVYTYIHQKNPPKKWQHHPHRFLFAKSTSWPIDRPQVWKKINTFWDSNQTNLFSKPTHQSSLSRVFYDALHLALLSHMLWGQMS